MADVPVPTFTDKLLRTVNIIGCLFLLGTNIFSFVNGQAYEWQNLYTYVSPSKWAFLIWFPINAFLFCTIIFQYSSEGKRIILDGIGWRFPLLTFLTGIHIILWSFQLYLFAFILAVCVSFTATYIYYIVKKHYPPANATEEIVIQWPFSLYHGWTTVLLVHTTFQAFSQGKDYGGVLVMTLVFLALFFLQAMGAVYAFSVYTKQGDLPAAIAIDWALWAIVIHQGKHPRFVHRIALVFALLGLLWVLKAAHGALRYTRDGRIALPDDDAGNESVASVVPQDEESVVASSVPAVASG